MYRHDRAQKLVLYGGLILFSLLHLYYLNAPPNGYHAWRESDTAAISLNYYQEDYNFLHPRTNQRGADDGITGMELPVTNYAAASLYKLVGPHHAVARGLVILMAVMTLIVVYKTTSLLVNPMAAAMTVWAVAFSPLFLFYSFKIMPDITMLMFMVSSLYLFLKYLKSNGLIYLLGSAVCLIISGAIKPLALSLFLPMAYLFWSKWRFDLRRILTLAVYMAVVFAAVCGWLVYARHVSRVHHSEAFYLGNNILEFPRYLFTRMFVDKLFLQWPAELWVGYALVPAFIWGLVAFWKTELRKTLLWWLLSIYLVFAVTAMHSSTHDYYTLVIVPLLAILSGCGLAHLFDRGGWYRRLAIVLLVLAPVTACLRIAHRFGPTTDYYEIRQASDERIPPGSLVAVEDRTKAVRLYQMNRHGWPIQDSVTAELVEAQRQLGAQYLVLVRPLEEYQGLSAGVSTVAQFRLGPLYAYELGEKN